MSSQTVNPATEEILREWSYDPESEVEEMVVASVEAFGHWRQVPLATRLECVRVFAEALRAGRMTLAELISREMGKPLKESLAEVDKSVASCLSLREVFPSWLAEREHVAASGHQILFRPLGPIFGVMPWNFPLWQVVRFAVPAMICGNSILLKHASNVWGSADLIGDLFRRSFPDGVYQNLRIDHEVAGKLIADFRVRGVSLTGSVRAGRAIGKLAGEHLKKCVLELGGSDAYVVLDDADVDHAAKVCAESRLINAGQSCVSAKRFVVTRKNRAKFTEGMIAHMSQVKIGDPLSPDTRLGPMARGDLREELETQVKASVAKGARAVLGGKPAAGRGYYYEPTVLEGVVPGQVAFDDELFGPVAAVIEAADEAEAIALANRSRFGLGGAIFSRDIERAKRLAGDELDTGMIAINDFVRSDAMAPFGGVKDSGLGRELGREGVFEFTNVKTVIVGKS